MSCQARQRGVEIYNNRRQVKQGHTSKQRAWQEKKSRHGTQRQGHQNDIDDNETRTGFKPEGVNPEMKVTVLIHFRSYSRQIMRISLAMIKYSHMLQTIFYSSLYTSINTI